jgi:tetratricopeptide (TPR) repeat protein
LSTKASGYYKRGIDRFYLGDNLGAIADFNQFLRANRDQPYAYMYRGMARRQLGDKPGAIEDFQKAADLFQKQRDRDNYEKAIYNIRHLQQLQ